MVATFISPCKGPSALLLIGMTREDVECQVALMFGGHRHLGMREILFSAIGGAVLHEGAIKRVLRAVRTRGADEFIPNETCVVVGPFYGDALLDPFWNWKPGGER